MGSISLQPIQIDPNNQNQPNQIAHYSEFSAGAGQNILKSNKEGFFIGADNFTDAPFSVDYNGSLNATTGTFGGKVEIKDGSNNVVILLDPNG